MTTPFRIGYTALLAIVTSLRATAGQDIDFSGTYSLTTDRDERLELILTQDRNGGVRGSLSGPGGNFVINGYIDQDAIVGTMHVERQPIDVQAWIDGAHLVMSLGRAPAGRLAYLPTTDLFFTKEFADPYDYGTRPSRGDPLAGRDPHGSGNPLSPYGPGSTPSFLGTFSDGHLVLELRGGGDTFTGYLTIDGRQYPLQARVSDGVLMGTFSNGLQEYQFVGTRDAYGLSLESDGQSYFLRYQEDFGPGPSGATRILSGNGPQAGGDRVLSDGSVVGMRWAASLRGSRIVQAGPGSIDVDFILCHDGRYLGTGLPDSRRGAPSLPITDSRGTWRVAAPLGDPYLELRAERGQLRRYQLSGDRGRLFLDGYPVSMDTGQIGC